MNPLKHYHNVVTLPSSIEDKLNILTDRGLFHKAEPRSAVPTIPDGFRPDGKPTVEIPGFLYPCYAPFYLGIPYPSTLAGVPEGYSSKAAIAAMQWLEKCLTNPRINLTHFDAEMFTAPIDGKEYRFCFPNTVFQYMDGDPQFGFAYRNRYAAVITVADVSDNRDDWEEGIIPFYMECQARLLLWCWNYAYGDQDDCPTECFVVRITGNTSGDMDVRVVHGDPQKDGALVKRICKRLGGKDPAAVTPNIKDQGTWCDRKEQEREEAYVVEDPDFYSLVRSYMETKTQRKTLEAESKSIKGEMDAIAIQLSQLIDSSHQFGFVADLIGGREYTVSHTRKRCEPAKINPPLLRQYYPEHADCIRICEVPRGVVNIEAE